MSFRRFLSPWKNCKTVLGRDSISSTALKFRVMVFTPVSPHRRPTSLPVRGKTCPEESRKGSPDNYGGDLLMHHLSLPTHPIHLHSARGWTVTSSTWPLPLADSKAEWHHGPKMSSPTSALPHSTLARGLAHSRPFYKGTSLPYRSWSKLWDKCPHSWTPGCQLPSRSEPQTPSPPLNTTLPNYLNSALPCHWVQNVWHTTPPGFCPATW